LGDENVAAVAPTSAMICCVRIPVIVIAQSGMVII
jgi:hypothetical protein